MLISSHGCDVDGYMITIDNTTISSTGIGVKIDNKLNFTEHILDVCKRPTSNWTFFFNYHPIVWMFTGLKSLDEIENIKKRALGFMLDDYGSSYHDL